MTLSDQRALIAETEEASQHAKQLCYLLENMTSRVRELCELLDFHDTGKGFRWQNEFKEMATSRGLAVCKATDSKHDCIVCGKRVQCKRIDKANGLICTTPIIGRSYCGYEISDWDVLALKQLDRVLIIPASAMLLNDGVRICNQVKPGEWCEWQDRWDVFGVGFSFVREFQSTLFFAKAGPSDGQ